ncbi:MAG TPA: hypothetical protein VG936_16985 [Lacunisphaera sp.]|nr:hypothetical protein [Lacunisphaera sp.]
MSVPEPTPQEKALRRVLKVSRANGWSVVVVASLGILLALLLGDLSSVFIGALVAFAGGMEVRGNKKLRRRDADGLKLLVRSQLFLLTVILVYCAMRLGSFDADTVMGSLTPDMEALLKESGIQRADILPLVRLAFYTLYFTLAVVSLLYQGGMALYYRAKSRRVREALAAPPAVAPNPPLA